MRKYIESTIVILSLGLILSGCFTIQKSRDIKDPAITTESWSIFPQWGKPNSFVKEKE